MANKTKIRIASVSNIDPKTGAELGYYTIPQTKEQLINTNDDWLGGDCSHYKILQSLHGSVWSDTKVVDFHNHFFDDYLPTNLFRSRSPFIRPKKQQNNNFELLNVLGELKETIENLADFFTGNFKVGHTSYGAYTWGAVPLFNDVKGALQSLGDVIGKKESDRIHKVRQQSFYNPGTANYIPIVHADGVTRISGEYEVNVPTDLGPVIGHALRLLDELGVHPDLKTAWDLTPLSFVADYLLPIGGLLDQLHPRGWGSYEVTFRGWLSVKYTFQMSHWDFAHWYERPRGFFTGKVYTRQWYDGISAPEKDAENFLAGYDAPSFKELFNSLYIWESMRTTRGYRTLPFGR